MINYIKKLYKKYKYRNKIRRLNTSEILHNFYWSRINELKQ